MADDLPRYSIENLQDLRTPLTPDTVEWCPINGYSSCLALGMYQLNEENLKQTSIDSSASSRRIGKLLIYDFHETNKLQEIANIDSAGILDMKWCPSSFNDCPVLATAQSNGEVVLYGLDHQPGEETQKPSVTKLAKCMVCESSLCLSLDWNCRVLESVQRKICVSDARGWVSVLSLEEAGVLKVTDSWRAHAYEAWTAAFDYWSPEVVYSGGDDGCFVVSDLRCLPTPVDYHKNLSSQMGICAIQSHHLKENVIFTGSYDDVMRVFDKRKLSNPMSQYQAGGGVWRIKPHPTDPNLLLLAAMYNGFHVVQLIDSVEVEKDCTNVINLTTTGEPQSQLCYGCSFRYKEDGTIFATCTFYDKHLGVFNLLHT